MHVLSLFSQPVATWFTQTFGEPTYTQELGWPALARGSDTLVCAPTGTGKTLCAFLLAIDRLLQKAMANQLTDGVRVLYISPLKALGNDIARNLDAPLEGIAQLAPEARRITKLVRTGDTPHAQRAQMAKKPPHILITTPESLYLLLTSKHARAFFASLETVIVDEIHAMLESKRGTHLSLSLERLRDIAQFQRIGLTATVEPLSEAADFLTGIGDRPREIIDARAPKAKDVCVMGAVEDFRELQQGTIWPEIAHACYDMAQSARQTLIFCNGRTAVENIVAGINLLAAGSELIGFNQMPGLPEAEPFALAHHGSIDRVRRHEAEERFKSGELRCLCATSSMELGIDVGDIELVIQVASPRSAARGLQRLGRSGHRPGDTSVMRILPRTADDALESALVARAMLAGNLEPMGMPKNCLDVLAQHIVSMVCAATWRVEEVFALVTRAYPYKTLRMEEFLSVLRMLRGDYEHQAGRDFRPRILWDEAQGTLDGDTYGRMLAVMGGTIPDRGYYPVVTPEGTRLGELEEEFVYEARLGDRFRLGAFTWAITTIGHDRVVVAPSSGAARAPFWRGTGLGRPSQTGEDIGRQLAELERAPNLLRMVKSRYPADDACAQSIARLLRTMIDAMGCLPTDRRVLVEHFRDESGECFVAIHCLLGGRVNQALAMLLEDAAARLAGRGVQAYHGDDGLMLHFVGSDEAPRNLLYAIEPSTAHAVILRDLPRTPRYAISFRESAAVALMLGMRKAGQRVPLWVQRLRGAEALSRAAETFDHPLIIEAYRECMERQMEIGRCVQLLRDVRSGAVEVIECVSEFPSPLTRAMKTQLIGEYTYVEAVPAEVAARGALADERSVVPPRIAARIPLHAESADQLYTLLTRRGTIAREEGGALAETLVESGRALWVEGLLVAAHEAQRLADGLQGDAEALRPFVLRYINAAGEANDDELQRFGPDAPALLTACVEDGDLTSYAREDGRYYALPERARSAMAAAVRRRRAQVTTQDAPRYAALLPAWQHADAGLSSTRIFDAMQPLFGYAIEKQLWESVVLPARVRGYRPRDLDHLLLSGEAVWRFGEGKTAFYPAEQPMLEPLHDDDAVYAALQRGGAMFLRQVSAASGVAGAELAQRLARLVERGLVVCDGFAPMRGNAREDGDDRAAVRKRVMARAGALSGEGRWAAAVPVAPLTDEEQIDALFDRWAILTRECVRLEGLAWTPLLETLRRMEYRDEVRRGYFIRGLYGIQFVRARQYERIRDALERPEDACVVLNAADPAQAWGGLLPGGGFMSVPGTAIVLRAGVPVLAAERRGEQLRLLDQACDADGLRRAAKALAEAFLSRRLWPDRLRVTVKSWPEGGREALLEAGFRADMRDVTLWRE